MKCANKVWFRPAAGVLGLALLVAAAVAVRAQEADPTARAVRLSFVEGGVQLSQGGAILADPALANTPIFEGSQITTGEDGRAELQFEDGSVFRISPNSALRLKVLRQQNGLAEAEAVLDNGLGYFELQGDSASSQIKVGFNNTVVTATGFTVIRVNLDNPPGEIAVFSGNAHLEHGTALSLDLHGGETVALNASDPGHYNLSETIEPDSWDAWNSDRDQLLTSQEAARTAATNSVEANNNPAWGDLDANGNWYNVPGEGYVWSPYQAMTTGWDPYGCGNWVWTPRYGYIWVSCNSWGYLPYTVGYWNYYDGFGWCWNPRGGYWWNGGGWGSNVGTMPVRYQPPHRPRGTPIKPGGGGGSPIRSGGKYQPNPVISYYNGSHRPAAAPVHAAGGPVTIAGRVVQPLRPITLRPTYNHEGATSTVVSRPPLTYPGLGSTTRPVYSPWANTPGGGNPRPGTWSGSTNSGGNIYRPSAPHPGLYGGVPAPRPSGGNIGGGGAGHVGGGGSINGGHVGGGGSINNGGNMGGGHVGGGGNVGGGGGGHVGGGGAPSPSAGPRH